MLPFFQQSFVQQATLFLMTLVAVGACSILGVQSDLISPLWQGLGVALPTLLGAHGIAAGVKAYRAEGVSVEERVIHDATKAGVVVVKESEAPKA